MKIDPRQFALRALETAKKDLSRDQYLVPVAYIVTHDEVLDYNLEYDNSSQKTMVYEELSTIARKTCAVAIITINDATIREARSSSAHDCIMATISGPGLRTWTGTIKYARIDDKFLFEDIVESRDDQLNLLPNWPRKGSAQ